MTSSKAFTGSPKALMTSPKALARSPKALNGVKDQKTGYTKKKSVTLIVICRSS